MQEESTKDDSDPLEKRNESCRSFFDRLNDSLLIWGNKGMLLENGGGAVRACNESPPARACRQISTWAAFRRCSTLPSLTTTGRHTCRRRCLFSPTYFAGAGKDLSTLAKFCFTLVNQWQHTGKPCQHVLCRCP